MKHPATLRRSAASISLVLAAVLMVVSISTQPRFDGTFGDRLAAISDAGVLATVSVYTFTFAQLAFLVAILGLAHLMRGSAPRLGAVAVGFAALGTLGHAVFGGISMVMIEMAADVPNRAVHTATLTTGQSGVSAPFSLLGLLGTVLALILTAVGLAWAKVGPRWAPWALGAFVVVEFVGGAVSEWAALGSGVLYTLALCTLAVTVWRSPAADWASRLDRPASSPDTAAVPVPAAGRWTGDLTPGA